MKSGDIDTYLDSFMKINGPQMFQMIQFGRSVLLQPVAEQRLWERASRAADDKLMFEYEARALLLAECREYGIQRVRDRYDALRELIMPDEQLRAAFQELQALLTESETDMGRALLERQLQTCDVLLPVLEEAGELDTWARAQAALAGVRHRLGTLTGRPEYFEAAIQGCDAATTYFTPDHGKPMWARIRVQRGTILSDMGELLGEPSCLDEALVAFHDGIDVFSSYASKQRLSVKNNEGNALTRLGEVLGKPEHLHAGVVAHETVIEDLDKHQKPIDWARSHRNLANSLRALGELMHDPTILARAVEACEEALSVTERSAEPLQWGRAHSLLGSSLQRLMNFRRLEKGDGENVVEAFTQALKECTQERVPMEWAAIQNNLGNCLSTLGENLNDPEYVTRGIEAYRLALLERTRQATPFGWAMGQHNIGICFRKLGDLTEDGSYYREAERAYQAALEVRTADRTPLDYLNTTRALARAMALRGDWAASAAVLNELFDSVVALLLGEATAARQQLILGELTGAGDDLAYSLLRQGCMATEVLAAAGRGRSLLLDMNLLLERGEAKPELRAARAGWRSAQQEFASRSHDPDAQSGLAAAYNRLRELLRASGLDSVSAPVATELSANVPANGALAIPILSDRGGAVLILTHAAVEPDILLLDSTTRDWLHSLLQGPSRTTAQGWFDAYNILASGGGLSEQKIGEFDNITGSVLRQLGQVLMAPLSERLQDLGLSSEAEIVLMPPGRLSILPLHAAPIDGRQLFLDRWVVRYIPKETLKNGR